MKQIFELWQDEESGEEDPVPEPEPEPEASARDPLEVEEELLMEKLQTAGFFLSMPEEEQIRKRLLEIKQMREHPEQFLPESTRRSQLSSRKTSAESCLMS